MRGNVTDHYIGKRLVLPELDMFGWDRHPRTVLHLGPHEHSKAFEVCYLVRGSVEWWCGPQVYQVRRGDLYITRPGERHGGVDSMMHPCELYFFQVRFPAKRTLPGLTAAQSRVIARGFAQLQQRCFAGSSALLGHFRAMHAVHRDPTTLGAVVARAALHQILVTVLTDHARAIAGRDAAQSRQIAAAVQWMQEHHDEPFHVNDVADAVGLGVSRFHELFVQETGFTPNDYRTRRKIAQARHLLRTTDRSVTELTFALGFSSSQYFATVFKKLTGMTPAEYRRRAGESA